MEHWTLITVTNGGEVRESQHASEALCKEAQSIALTGMTIAENEAADAAYEEYLKQWDEDHPWRDPTTDYEKKLLQGGGAGSISSGSRCLAYDASTGKVRDLRHSGMSASYSPENGESVEYVRGCWVHKNKNDIKYAKIVPPRP